MKFPNAYQGVKKVFSSKILDIIAAVCIFIAGIAAVVAAAGTQAEDFGVAALAAGGGLLVAVIFLTASVVLTIISEILKLVGLKKASADESKFNSAFVMAIFVLIITVVSAILSTINGGRNFFDDLATGIAGILNIAMMIYVSQGITSLAEQLGNEKIAGTGRTVVTLYSVILLIGILVRTASGFMILDPNLAIASGILMIISAILSAIAYVIYVIFLGRAKKMLSRG